MPLPLEIASCIASFCTYSIPSPSKQPFPFWCQLRADKGVNRSTLFEWADAHNYSAISVIGAIRQWGPEQAARTFYQYCCKKDYSDHYTLLPLRSHSFIIGRIPASFMADAAPQRQPTFFSGTLTVTTAIEGRRIQETIRTEVPNLLYWYENISK